MEKLNERPLCKGCEYKETCEDYQYDISQNKPTRPHLLSIMKDSDQPIKTITLRRLNAMVAITIDDYLRILDDKTRQGFPFSLYSLFTLFSVRFYTFGNFYIIGVR